MAKIHGGKAKYLLGLLVVVGVLICVFRTLAADTAIKKEFHTLAQNVTKNVELTQASSICASGSDISLSEAGRTEEQIKSVATHHHLIQSISILSRSGNGVIHSCVTVPEKAFRVSPGTLQAGVERHLAQTLGSSGKTAENMVVRGARNSLTAVLPVSEVAARKSGLFLAVSADPRLWLAAIIESVAITGGLITLVIVFTLLLVYFIKTRNQGTWSSLYRKRLLLPISGMLVVVLATAWGVIQYQFTENLTQLIKVTETTAEREMKVDIENMAVGMEASANLLASDPLIQSALLERNMGMLAESYVAQKVHNLSLDLSLSYFELILPDLTCLGSLLKNGAFGFFNVSEKGDENTLLREAAQSGKRVWGINLGYTRNVAESVSPILQVGQPVSQGEKFLGYLLLSRDLDILWNLTQERIGGDIVVAIRKNHWLQRPGLQAERAGTTVGQEDTRQSIIVHSTLPLTKWVHDVTERLLFADTPEIKQFETRSGYSYYIHSIPLEEVSGKHIGVIAVISDTTLELSYFSKLKNISLMILGVSSVLIIAAVLYLTSRSDQMVFAKTKELQESQKLLADAETIGRMGSWKIDLGRNTLTWSDEVYHLFGFEPRQFAVSYETFLEMVHPDDRQTVDDAYSESVRNCAEGYQVEHRIVLPTTGEIRYVVERCRHVKDDHGRVIGSIGSAQDITEAKETQMLLSRSNRELIESLENLQTILQVLPIGVMIFNSAEMIIHVNPAAQRIFNQPDVDQGTVRCGDFIGCCNRHDHPEGCGYTTKCEDCGIYRTLREALAGNGLTESLETFVTRDLSKTGKWLRISARGYLIAQEQAAILVIEDVSQQKHDHDLLRQAHDFYEAVLHAANEGIAVCHGVEAPPYIRFSIWNPAMEQLTGYTMEEISQQGWYQTVYKNEQIRALAVERMDRMRQGDHLDGEEWIITCKGGGTKTVRISTTSLPLKNDRPPEVLAVFQDITGLKEALAQREETNAKLKLAVSQAKMLARQAEKANEAKSMFLSHMSHEIRTPLNSILGFAQLLSRDPLVTERQRSDVKTILRSGQDLFAIINDVLEISRIESGKGTLTMEPFSPKEIVFDLESIFNSGVENRQFVMAFEYTGADLVLLGDKVKIKQIFSNLISNSIKYTNKGKITVRLRCREESAFAGSPAMIRLVGEVEDTGSGIAPGMQEKLFQPFSRQEEDFLIEGTGLGLAIIKYYVDMMEGEITVESEHGKGSLFRFSALLPQGTTMDVDSVQSKGRVVKLNPASGHIRILLVDDDSASRVFLQAIMLPLGFEVKQATTGGEALDIVTNYAPHLVLMDLHLPDMNGYELAGLIKQHKAGDPVKIIAVTASAMQHNRETFSLPREMIDDLLYKPLDIDTLLEMIKRHLDLHYDYESSPATGDQRHIPQKIMIPPLAPRVRRQLLEAIEDGDMHLFMEFVSQHLNNYQSVIVDLKNLADTFDYQTLRGLLASENNQEGGDG